MEKQNKIYSWYLWIIIIYSGISILLRLSAIIFNQSVIFGIPNIMFIFSVIMLIIFIINKIEKISWLFSGLFIFETTFYFGVSMFFSLLMGVETFSQSLIGPIITLFYLMIPLAIAIKLLVRNYSKEKISKSKKSVKKKVTKKRISKKRK